MSWVLSSGQSSWIVLLYGATVLGVLGLALLIIHTIVMVSERAKSPSDQPSLPPE